MLLFIEDAVRGMNQNTLKYMSEALQKFNQWKAVREKQLRKEVKRLHNDGGSEFTLKKFAEYLQSEGIQVETTALYISQSNGEVE
jgi:hypothetical protein